LVEVPLFKGNSGGSTALVSDQKILQTSSKRQGGFIVVYRLMAKVSDAHQVEATPRRKALTV